MTASAISRRPGLADRASTYAWVGLTAIRSNLSYLAEVGTRVIFLGVILFIFLQLWRVTYSGTGATKLGGLTLAQMLWYLCMTEAIIMSAPAVSTAVDQDVRTGAIAVYLLRPLSYPLYRLFTTLGERAVRFALNLVVGAVIVLCFVGPIHFSALGLLMLTLSIPLAIALDFLANLLIGLGAFWMEDTSGLSLIYNRLQMILGGMLIPLELFPRQLQPLLRALPFSSVVYGPARLFVAPNLSLFEWLVVHQGLFALTAGLLVALIYRVGLRKVQAHGG